MTVRLPARPDSAALARHEVRDLLGPDAAEAFASRCVLVVSELVADAIEHRAEPAQVDVDLTLELTRVGLSVTVSDSGEGLYIADAPEATNNPSRARARDVTADHHGPRITTPAVLLLGPEPTRAAGGRVAGESLEHGM